MRSEAKLRELLMEIYVSGVLWHDGLPYDEQARLLDTVSAAAEGHEFELLGLPFPRDAAALSEAEKDQLEAAEELATIPSEG